MTVHVPIMAPQIIEALVEGAKKFPEGGWILDGTFGGGGHTGLLLSRLASEGLSSHVRVLSIDQDPAAVQRGREKFAKETSAGHLELAHLRMSQVTETYPDRQWIGIMADLGFSSDQIENAEKGLSFMLDGPLDMRMDPSRPESARELLRRLRESEIADLLYEFGEERHSRRIAGAVVRARSESRLPDTTKALAELIFSAYPMKERHGRIHPATRSFQALRIFVNDELSELDSLLRDVIIKLSPGGRAAILSFHSLEDRRVKHRFGERDGPFAPLTKKPLEADEQEVVRNPRARSAKLRIAEKKGT